MGSVFSIPDDSTHEFRIEYNEQKRNTTEMKGTEQKRMEQNRIYLHSTHPSQYKPRTCNTT
jgi:hypothetical protein